MSRRRRSRLRPILLLGVLLGVVAKRARARRSPGGSRSGKGYRTTPFWRAYDRVSALVDRRVGWDKLPTPAGLLVLIGLRNTLRRQNLHDTARAVAAPGDAPPFDSSYLANRTADGTYNDLEHPTTGARHTRFGRNVPIGHTRPDPEPDILEPNPRTISRELMTRHEFVPATTINVLAACWIQFMVKDWFNHGQGDPARHWPIPIAEDDDWPERPMKILKTLADPTADPASTDPPTFVNHETHWWDGSQIYGSTKEGQAARRAGRGGHLVIGDDGRLVVPDDPARDFTRVPGWWLGIDILAVLFVKEHNAVCDRLADEYPHWSDEELFQRARLVIAALMAKIHTVEWTPAIIAHPTTVAALRANWWGLASERVRRAFGRISHSEVISGIPGSHTDHYGIPYSLTEEFTVVYRMHPLTRDDHQFRSVADDSVLGEEGFRELAGPATVDVTRRYRYEDVFYSFGTEHPGALVLNNFPRFLQNFQRPDHPEVLMDLAAIDIMRSRELGVPRYNEFRRLLHLKPASSFADLCGPGNGEVARRMSDIYGGDIERVDLIVGMFAEKPPRGFGFSDTAFRIFILMASRRLNSDRFFTKDFTPEVYSQVGYDWVQRTSMADVLLRHYPSLRPSLRGVANPFAPWARVGASAGVAS
jgi:hypothetical protein